MTIGSPWAPAFAGATKADLVAEDLACRRGERLVFAGLSFRLRPGGALVLTGANGSGKTSLLRLLAGLIGPAAGRLAWGETPIAEDVAEHRARLHYVGHQDGVKPGLTPRETLVFWAALRGREVRRDAPMLAAALSAFALEPVADWPCRWLSAGQRRRRSRPGCGSPGRCARSPRDAPRWPARGAPDCDRRAR